MLRIHKEGYRTIAIIGIIISGAIYLVGPANQWWSMPIAVSLVILFLLVLYFFRNPRRPMPASRPEEIIAPADGKIVAIEEVQDDEFFNDKRLQISIFMSPLDVHINWHPISGEIIYKKYHPGKYLVAWHPKSSSDNERTTVVYQDNSGSRLLVRQIAGAMARRIVCYPEVGDVVTKRGELGFIKFGSRVDVLIPSSTKIEVQLGQRVKGSQSVLASI